MEVNGFVIIFFSSKHGWFLGSSWNFLKGVNRETSPLSKNPSRFKSLFLEGGWRGKELFGFPNVAPNLRFIHSQLPHWSMYVSITSRVQGNQTGPQQRCLKGQYDATWWIYDCGMGCQLMMSNSHNRILQNPCDWQRWRHLYVYFVFQLQRIGESRVGVFVGFSKRLPPWKLTYLPKMDEIGRWSFPFGFLVFWSIFRGKLLFVSGRVWTTSPVPKEATRCFTAVATLEGEDKGNAREATEDRLDEIGPVGLFVWLSLVGVCYIDDSIYIGNLSSIEKEEPYFV